MLLGVDIIRDLELNANVSIGVAHVGRLKHELCLHNMGTAHWAVDLCVMKPAIRSVEVIARALIVMRILEHICFDRYYFNLVVEKKRFFCMVQWNGCWESR